VALVVPASADTEFTAKRSEGKDVPHGKGQCDIALNVEGAVEVSVHGDRVAIRDVAGAAKDAGSECSAPLPTREFEGFQFSVKEKHGEIELAQPPGMRNDFRAKVFMRVHGAAEGHFRFRLTWKIPDPLPPPGMSFNNSTHAAGRGHGDARLEGGASRELGDAVVDFDRGGKLLVVFTQPHGDKIAFRGLVASWESGVMKANVEGDETFDGLRGPMYLYFSPKQQVYKITLKATDGQQHLMLAWDSAK
jgi:hypothetical protein